jgi:hypothetical protein
MLLLALVLVGVFVAPLLGLVESTVTLCAGATLGNANPVRTATNGSAASHDNGLSEFLSLFIFLLFQRVATKVARDLRGVGYTRLRIRHCSFQTFEDLT